MERWLNGLKKQSKPSVVSVSGTISFFFKSMTLVPWGQLNFKQSFERSGTRTISGGSQSGVKVLPPSQLCCVTGSSETRRSCLLVYTLFLKNSFSLCQTSLRVLKTIRIRLCHFWKGSLLSSCFSINAIRFIWYKCVWIFYPYLPLTSEMAELTFSIYSIWGCSI